MNVFPTDLPEVLVIEPELFGDQRGFFLETYSLPRYVEHGIKRPFVQDNMSRSAYGVLRGLHLQIRTPRASWSRSCVEKYWTSRLTFDAAARPSADTLPLS